MVKLSSAQQMVMQRMKEGWKLWIDCSAPGRAWLEQEGFRIRVHLATVDSLLHKGFIREERQSPDIYVCSLVEEAMQNERATAK